jgi:integrase
MASVRKREWKAANGEMKVAWVVDYSDGAGARRLKTFPTKKAATEWRDNTQHEVKQGTHTPESTSITLAEAAELWLQRARNERLERGTIEKYEAHVRLHIVPRLGATKLATLTAPQVERFKDHLLDKLSQPMARKVLFAIKAILNEACRRGLVAQNVARGARIRANTREQGKVVIPSKAQILGILNAAEGRWKPFLVTAVYTGMRASELRGLRWADVDFPQRLIHVTQRADAWGTIGKPKSKAGHRSIPMGPAVVSILKEWRMASPRKDGLVFPNAAGKPMNLSNVVRDGYGPAQEKAGITKPYGLHALRHFAASTWIEAGFTPKRLQALLGHSSIVMTFDRYGHLFPSPEDDHAKFAAIELAMAQ